MVEQAELEELRHEVKALRHLVNELMAELARAGTVDAGALRTRAARKLADEAPVRIETPNAERRAFDTFTGGGPYRSSSAPLGPVPPGKVRCARCGIHIAERKAFMSAEGRFCQRCFEPFK